MQVDKYGSDVGYDKRLTDIRKRYGEDSRVFKEVSKLVLGLKNKNIG